MIGYLALPYLFLDTIGTFVASGAFGFGSGAAVGDYVNSIRPRDDGPTWLQPARDQQQHRAFADALCEAGAHQC